MKKDFFQGKITQQIGEQIDGRSVSFQRWQEIARSALDFSRKHAEHIPNEAVLDFLEQHPEIEGEFRIILEREDAATREATIEGIRQLLKDHSN